MGLGEIEAGIRELGRRQVDEITRHAREEKAKIRQEFESRTERRCAEVTSESSQRKASVRRSILSAARLEASSMIALEKEKTVEEVFKAARERVLGLPAGRKKKLLMAMLEDRTLIDGKTVVLAGVECARLLQKNDGLAVRVQDIGDFGVIITSEDGRIAIDKRLDTALAGLKEDITSELHKMLFAQQR
jgi:vacuolar-type H+-ATPase subunit E/Vma4